MKNDHVADRRTELLEAIVDALLDKGVADLSLRPLAERVGSSARLLIYHFDSKENLVAAALERVRDRIASALHALGRDGSPERSLSDSLVRFWCWATSEENQKYFRLLFEIDGLSMYDNLRFSQETRAQGASVWLNLVHRAEAASGDPISLQARTTLIWTTIAGLLHEFLSTGDKEGTTAAFRCFLSLIEARAVV
jgi:AcrR family transcriptional regulator